MTRPAPSWVRSLCEWASPVLAPAVCLVGCVVAGSLYLLILVAFGVLRAPWYLVRIGDKEKANLVWDIWAAVVAAGPRWQIDLFHRRRDW